jgi:hypothetical protein
MLLRSAALLLALAASSLAWGEALDPRERLAYLSYVEGPVTFEGAGVRATSLPDRPLRRGDRLTTDRDGRAELWIGAAAVRLDEHSELTLARLDDTRVQIRLERGTLSLQVRALLEGETIEVATPLRTIALAEPGEYRVEVAAVDTVALTVYAGAASFMTDGGPLPVAAGQRVRLETRHAVAILSTLPPADAFDDWILARELRLAEAEAAPEDPSAYDDLDRYGDWYGDAVYGRVWSPHYTNGWTPIHDRHWRRDGFGWSWVIAGSWGFVTYGSGHWWYVDHLNRWCWVPRPVHHSETFARETHPYRSPRVRTASYGADQAGRAAYYGDSGTRSRAFGGSGASRVSGTSGASIFRSFGSGSQSAGSGSSGSSRGVVATMRPSGSSSSGTRSSSSSTRGSASVFAGPGTR